MRKLLILGAGGHGRVVADAAIESGYDEIAFLDDAATDVMGGKFPVIGRLNDFAGHRDTWHQAFVAIGANAKRLELVRALAAAGFATPVIIHPRAYISRYSKLGNATVVAAGSVINPGVTIGLAAIINTGCTIDHDCNLGNGVHISPGANVGGNVAVGDRTWIGIGASVRHGVTIGSNVVVGAGAAVIADVDDNLTLVGVPARPISQG